MKFKFLGCTFALIKTKMIRFLFSGQKCITGEKTWTMRSAVESTRNLIYVELPRTHSPSGLRGKNRWLAELQFEELDCLWAKGCIQHFHDVWQAHTFMGKVGWKLMVVIWLKWEKSFVDSGLTVAQTVFLWARQFYSSRTSWNDRMQLTDQFGTPLFHRFWE